VPGLLPRRGPLHRQLKEPHRDRRYGRKGQGDRVKIVARLKSHAGNPTFVALGERLERLREWHYQGLFNSIEFLKALLTIARYIVAAERRVDPVDEQAKATLTELFSKVKNGDTPVFVERIAEDIARVVQAVRFYDRQAPNAGERTVKQELRKIADIRYKVKHANPFDRVFGYV
jgi:type I restriction enzyme R subunit